LIGGIIMNQWEDLLEVRQSPIRGRGVFVKWATPRGSIVLAIDDSDVVDPDDPEQRKLIGAEPNHCDYLPDGTVVHWKEPEVLINHSCEPNVHVAAVGGHRFVAAMRDIAAGEEIVFDYAINAVDGDWMECRCGAPTCRGRHQVDFFALPEHRQLEYLPYLDCRFAQVHRERLLALLEGAVGRIPE
jgi:hypothetical protein